MMNLKTHWSEIWCKNVKSNICVDQGAVQSERVLFIWNIRWTSYWGLCKQWLKTYTKTMVLLAKCFVLYYPQKESL